MDDSYHLYFASLLADIFEQEVVSGGSAQLKSTPCSIPKNVKEALSPQFVDEWRPAINNENACFAKYKCFHPVPLPAQAKILPGIWVFTQKRDGSPNLS